MSVLIAALLVQYVISVKAGLVNHVQGSANVAELETVPAGQPIRTGANGFVEILLRPGSFLRLGENSEATLDDSDLASVKVTIVHGPALIEAAELTKDHPITVTTGNLTTKISDTGIYRFEDGTATVLDGKLETADSKLTYAKGWQIFYKDNYRARKVATVQATSLDVYSQTRSGAIANANLTMVSTLGSRVGYNTFDLWLYSPYLHLYTYLPTSNYRSPYGYRYYTVANRIVRPSGGGGVTNPNGNAGNTNPAQPVDNGNSNAGPAPAPAPTASTPSGERSTPATYIDSKSSAVGATAR